MAARKTASDMKKELLKLWVLICVMTDMAWRQNRQTHKQDFTVILISFGNALISFDIVSFFISRLSEAEISFLKAKKKSCVYDDNFIVLCILC